jgi:hypothetical protein
MSEWRSVFTRKLEDGGVSQSSRTFRGSNDSEASGAAVRDASFWKMQNYKDPRVTTHVEKIS